MNSTDAELIRDIRRELGKRPINATRLDIEVVNGRVMLGGIVTQLREAPNANVKEEMAAIERILVRNSRVKAFSNTSRIILDTADEHEGHDSRGRVRH